MSIFTTSFAIGWAVVVSVGYFFKAWECANLKGKKNAKSTK